MKYTSQTHTTDIGAQVESATVSVNGHEFTALGSLLDEANGLIVGYVSERVQFTTGEKRFYLTTWEGVVIAPLESRDKWKQNGFGGVRNEIWAWGAIVNGRKYSGRNSGPVMVIRMRAVKP